MVELKEINAQIHDEFMQNSTKEHFMQSSIWAKAKETSGWSSKTVGLYDDQKLVASSLLLFRKIPFFNSYICYAPRGYVVDFDNEELVKQFTQKLFDYCKKLKVCYVMIDPDVIIKKINAKEEVIEEQIDFVDKMKALGYFHQGYNKEFEMTQPRFTFRLKLDKSKEEIFSNYSKVIRASMKNADRIGIICKIEENIDKFYDIMQDTAKRNDFVERSKDYYQLIYNEYKKYNMATCYSATYYGQAHLQAIKEKKEDLEKEKRQCLNKLQTSPQDTKSENRIKQIDVQLDKMKKDLDKVNQFILDYPDGLTLSSGITLNTKHRAWLVYGGNLSIMRDVAANYAIKQFEINDDINKGFEFVDFFGTCEEPVTNKEYAGIHEFKKRFSGDYCEFAGEFHLVIKPLTYAMWIKAVPMAKKIMRKIKKRKS